MKQKICHDDSSPDTIHIDTLKAQELLDEKIKFVSIGFAEWISEQYLKTLGGSSIWYKMGSGVREGLPTEVLFQKYMDSIKNK